MPHPTAPKQFLGVPAAVAGAMMRLAELVNMILRGGLNNSGTVTLTANAATTTLTDARIGFDSAIALNPTTANAATALATTYILETGRLNGSVVITHANNAQTDRTFRWAVMG